MKKGGRYDNPTVSGLCFENKNDLKDAINNMPQYCVKGHDVFKNEENIGILLKKHMLYNFLKSKDIDWNEYISKQLLPDDAIYIYPQNKLYILEKKYQEVNGSVDEKLQTCDFKKLSYSKLMSPLDISVEYIYILSDFFKQTKYKDSLEYIKSVGCDYYFNEIPLDRIGL